MDIQDIQLCSDFYTAKYLDNFYIITTYNGRSFILIGERENFAHLMGISQRLYRSHGYRNPRSLYRDIHDRMTIDYAIIPRVISTSSKMYKKAINFRNSNNLFWRNARPIIVNYDPSKSTSHLNNVNMLLTDINEGYMLGWIMNSEVPVNDRIKIKKYCISSWIDESLSTLVSNKEKYLPNQSIELLRYIFAFDSHSNLIRHKEYKYTQNEKLDILKIASRNSCNLLLDQNNFTQYVAIARNHSVSCIVNGVAIS